MGIKRFINILIFLFIFSLYFVTFFMIYDNFRDRKLNSKEKDALEIFEEKIEKKKEEVSQSVEEQPQQSYTINYGGYTILGTIYIPRIGLNTVIIGEQTYSAMNIGAIKTYGVDLNNVGGFVIAAHNFRGRSAFFYYIYTLEYGDVIHITDSSGRTMTYTVYEVDRYVDPNDVSYFSKTDDYHMTIVTCEDGGKSRIIVKARVM